MVLASKLKRLLAASVLGVAAASISVPAEARMGGFGHMGGVHHMGGMGGFHHGGFAGRRFGGFGGFHHGFRHRGFGFGGRSSQTGAQPVGVPGDPSEAGVLLIA
jgi:hypothetical protein